jgi:phosphatidylglycerophosphate synthase
MARSTVFTLPIWSPALARIAVDSSRPMASPRLALIGIASLTDFLDGWLASNARRIALWRAVDPVADRFLCWRW